MEHLNLYEEFEWNIFKKTFQNWLLKNKPFKDVKSVEEITCTNSDLIDLEGIEKLINLKYLDCRQNKLLNLSGIENLIKLETLYIGNNKLNRLEELSDLVNLTHLDCSHNNLINLDGIENLKKLKYLVCSYNKLTDLSSIKNMLNLEYLYCNNNQLTSLEFGDYAIEALELEIDVPSISRFKNLKNISFAMNKFSSRYEKFIIGYLKGVGLYRDPDRKY